ncbi:C-C motif chemokine 8-like isoform X1 [Astyanax mexicanus]|uniref:C-C motif chemokine 8-like isoform X1 n=1 Tax=Astyanax mexicanus TaxID=7994 RepID=A0A8B9GXQ9_ASTMX|nr:C-C motif chemokine 8-like isoform X1 [Astyanax mexicanus]
MQCWSFKLAALAALLVLFGCLGGVSANYRRPTRVGLLCCDQVSTAPIPREIKLTGYKHQNALAPCVEAIIFFAGEDKYCSDPKARWIQRRQKGLPEFKN